MTDNEANLIARSQAGEQEAFRQLVERHSADAFRLAYRLVSDAESADDVVQEALLKAWRSLHRFDARSRFSTWLHRITANCAMDHLRRQRREVGRGSHEAAELVLARRPSIDPGPERLAASGQIERRMELALATLTPRERTAFVLRHFEEESIADISRTLGAGISATKQAIFRAVRKLRGELAPWMEVEDAHTA